MLDSIFLGGGTPSLMSAGDIGKILETASQTFGLKSGAEITLEANPNNASDHDVLRDWKHAGVNRLSIGAQSFDFNGLRLLGRDHSGTEAYAALCYAPQHFDFVSVDMIYAWPGQSLKGWEEELQIALQLSSGHLSLYELTIEQRTAFGKQVERGTLIPKDGDEQADFYDLTQDMCNAYNSPAYEVSNHAWDPEHESVHNHIYWNSGDWVGVGPGAHGRLTIGDQRIATEAARRPADYIAASAPTETILSSTDTAREFLAMGLRPVKGLDLKRYEDLFGHAPAPSALTSLAENGQAILAEGRLCLTQEGRLLGDRIAGLLA